MVLKPFTVNQRSMQGSGILLHFYSKTRISINIALTCEGNNITHFIEPQSPNTSESCAVNAQRQLGVSDAIS